MTPFLSFPRRRIVSGGGGGDATVSYVSQASSATAGTTHTFSSQAIGSGTYVVVAVNGASASANAFSSITVAGSSATIVGSTGSAQSNAAIAIIAHPGGSTATIVVTMTGSMARCGLTVWAVSGIASTTAHDVQSDTLVSTNTYSVSLNVPAGGVAVAASFNNSLSSHTATWAGVTEDTTELFFASGRTLTSGDMATATLQSGMTVSVTYSGAPGTNSNLIAASWDN